MRKFNLYLAILSLIIDVAALVLALAIAYQLRSDGTPIYLWPFNEYLKFVLKFLPVWLLLMASQGLYHVRNLPTGWNALGRLIIAIMSGWGVMLITLYLSRSPAALVFPRLVIAYGMILTLVFTFGGRFLLQVFRKSLNRSGRGLIRTAVIINGSSEHFLAELNRPAHARKVIATIAGDYINELNQLKTERLDEIVVADEHMDEKTLFEILDWSEAHNVNFGRIPSLLSVRATNIEVGTLAGTPVIYYRQSPLDGWGRVFKRILDLILVIPALVILSPVFLVLALIVKLGSKGPVIYKEPRVGQDGKILYVGKFRSMYPDWRERFPNLQDWSADEATDPRITPIGRVIRRTNLDELPQLWDVLVGRMSIVGPRPEQPKYVEKFQKEIPTYIKRHHVKAGLTGWAQVNGARGNTPIDERVKYDLYYIENWSILFDLRIIFATFLLIFRQVTR